MKYTIPGPLPDHARNLMRRVGYGEQQKRSGQISYVRRVSGADFPRYHAYVEDVTGGGIQVNLHVDQKAASYQGSHAHSGEYEGPLVEKEMSRIVQFVLALNQPTVPTPPPTKKPASGGFISKFFS